MCRQLIAVVDDEPMVVQLCSIFLRTAGYRVAEFGGGRELLSAYPPGMTGVLLGLCMPEPDGFAVLAELRRAMPGLPVLTMSAMYAEWSTPKLKGLGAAGHLPKPFGVPEFLAATLEVFGPWGDPTSRLRR